MVKLEKVVNFLDNYLSIKDFEKNDNSWNGLQVEGKSEVKKIMFAADAGIESFEQAVKIGADIIVVHHGIFWEANNPSIKDHTKKRVSMLLKNGISLYAAHLPLDKHPVVGNNAQLLQILGFEQDKSRPFGYYKGEYLSFIGKTSKPKTIDQLVKILNKEIGAECKVLPFGSEKIRTVAVCSGGAGYAQLDEAVNAGVDLYVTGDSTEFYHTARDIGFNVIFAGHHATEIVGERALSKVVAKALKVETVFVDIPTGL